MYRKGGGPRVFDRAPRHASGEWGERFQADGKDMGDQDMGVGGAFASWDRELKARAGAHNLPKVERQCTHFKEGSEGRPFDGEIYLKALQRMKGSSAARLARKVESFFWSDARKVRVWLCADCAAEAGLAA
jgi:hypothetical protein